MICHFLLSPLNLLEMIKIKSVEDPSLFKTTTLGQWVLLVEAQVADHY